MQKVMLVGTTLTSTKAQQDALIKQLQTHMPDRKVLIVPGLLWVSEHEVNETIEAAPKPRSDAGVPERAKKKRVTQEGAAQPKT